MKKKKKKKSGKWIVLGVVLVLVLLGVGYFFGLVDVVPSGEQTRVIRNPVLGLSNEQALQQFDESFVLYLLASIGAQNLKKIPLTSNRPKIDIYVGDEVYGSEVKSGAIGVSKSSVDGPDIIIYTSKLEAVQMLRDRNYVFESFSSGGSKIELVAGKPELLAKGYLGLYEDLTGEEVAVE